MSRGEGAQARGWLSRTQRMLKDHPHNLRLLTGGGAELLAGDLPEFELSPYLSLRGFALLADELLGMK